MTTPNDFLDIPFDGSLTPAVVDAKIEYPTIQWSHSNPTGWLLPADRVEEFDVQPPAGWERRTAQLGGSDVPCYFAPSATVAILTWTKQWFIREDDRDRFLDKYQDGARSRTHILCIVKGSPDLFVLTFKGMTSADFHGGISRLQGNMKRQSIVRPGYFFWLALSAGQAKRIASGAMVAPLLVEQPAKGEDLLQWLKARFTGAEFVADVEAQHTAAIREFNKPRERADAEATNGHDATTPAPLPATGPAPTSAATTTTSAAPWDAMPSATGDRAVALGLAQRWTHEAAVEWAMSLGAFDDAARARADYTFLWNRAKAENGGRIAQLAEWWPVWVDAVLATVTDQVAVEEPGF